MKVKTISELVSKYGIYANKISKGFERTFKVLPLVTVIDNSVLVCHGGVSDITDLEYINNIPRHKVCLFSRSTFCLFSSLFSLKHFWQIKLADIFNRKL